MKLTDDQKNFLSHYNISETEIFDATGMKPKEYRIKMKTGGYKVAIGVSECAASNHKMRNRHGNCVQCFPESLAFVARYSKTMYLYIAQPSNSNLTKVGITENPSDRVRQLNLHKLGGLTTWEIKYSVECPNAGRIEDHISNLLSGFNVPTPYLSKSGEVCEEVYACTLDQARGVLNAVLTTALTRNRTEK